MIKKTNSLTAQIFFQSTKSTHFPLRGKVGQLSKRKRVLCWSIFIISLWARFFLKFSMYSASGELKLN